MAIKNPLAERLGGNAAFSREKYYGTAGHVARPRGEGTDFLLANYKYVVALSDQGRVIDYAASSSAFIFNAGIYAKQLSQQRG